LTNNPCLNTGKSQNVKQLTHSWKAGRAVNLINMLWYGVADLSLQSVLAPCFHKGKLVFFIHKIKQNAPQAVTSK